MAMLATVAIATFALACAEPPAASPIAPATGSTGAAASSTGTASTGTASTGTASTGTASTGTASTGSAGGERRTTAYAEDEFVDDNGYLGRSHGCPAVAMSRSAAIIDVVKEGTLIFSYFPDDAWLGSSPFLQ